MRLQHVFLTSLLLSLTLQGLYWNHFDVLDGHHWIEGTEALMTLSHTMFDAFIYGYPGTPPMMMAIGVHWLFGIPLSEAFYGSLAIIISLATAGAALLCKSLRPTLPWWVGTTIVLSTTSLYRHATPPSAVAFPFIVILILLVLYIYEKKPIQEKWPFIALGISIGASAAARLDITLFVVGIQLLFLALLVGWSAIIFTALVAFLTFCLLNPFMWLFPLHHLRSFLLKVFYHYNGVTDVMPPFSTFIKISPFSWLGLLYATLLAFWRKTNSILPRMFLLNMLLMTTLLVAILFSSTYRPLWYFSPLLLIWEVLFILLLLELTSRATYALGFTRQSLFGLYIFARIAIFGMQIFNRHPALLFFD